MKVGRLVLLPMMIFLFTLWLHLADAEQLAPKVLPLGVSVKPVLEASLGAPPTLGWKWQIQERMRAGAGAVTRHTNSALYYTLDGTHELVRGETIQTLLGGQAVFIPAGVEHIHRMLPPGSSLRTFEIYFARGDGSPPTAAGVRLLHFSDNALDLRPGVIYTIRVDEVTLVPGAQRELTPNLVVINYILEGTNTRRVGDQVFRYEPGEAIELSVGAPFMEVNEGTTPLRFLEVMLVPTATPPSALSH
jgi:mannose-6-phosphate isomerase-like protein (cupin superfamily)